MRFITLLTFRLFFIFQQSIRWFTSTWYKRLLTIGGFIALVLIDPIWMISVKHPTYLILELVLLSFLVLDLFERMLFKKLSSHVILSRALQKIGMTTRGLGAKNAADLRKKVKALVEEFVLVGIPKLPPGKTYTLTTHQLILDELLKHHPFKYDPIGKAILKEKTLLRPLRELFNKRRRRLYFYREENMYKVTVTRTAEQTKARSA